MDTEAGIEHFGRGVREGGDVVLAVADPSREAVMLVEKACLLCRETGKPFLMATNKAEGGMEDALREMLAAADSRLSGTVPYSPAVSGCNPTGSPLAVIEAAEVREGLESIHATLKETVRATA